MPDRDPLDPYPEVDNDGLGVAQTRERSTWGLPSDEGQVGQEAAQLPPQLYDYSAGILVGHDVDADAQAGWPVSHLLGARTDAPAQFQLPHEALHRRYEPPRIALINQTAAGFTVIAAANQGLHLVKLIACFITLDAAGTLKFVQGSATTSGSFSGDTADITGAMNLGGASAPPLLLPPAELANPWLYTAPDQALGIFTATGKAQGWALFAYSPYDD